jgi:hypothetical protein
MRANRVEVSWDVSKKKWIIRIQAGEEVIRRHCNLPRDAGEQALLAAAQQTVKDEGYEIDPTQIVLQRESASV